MLQNVKIFLNEGRRGKQRKIKSQLSVEKTWFGLQMAGSTESGTDILLICCKYKYSIVIPLPAVCKFCTDNQFLA